MKFYHTPLTEAEGAILAHSLRIGSLNFKKGRKLDAADVEALRLARVESVVAAHLEEDVHEDAAAQRLAQALAGTGTSCSAAFTRCNMWRPGGVFSSTTGIAWMPSTSSTDPSPLERSNPYTVVEPKQMLGTVKIIPFAAPQTAVDACLKVAREADHLMRVASFKRKQVGLIQTSLPGQKDRCSTRLGTR